MRVFKLRLLAKFARKERITDASLFNAAVRASSGLIDADLGGGLIKQRVARRGQGRSAGYRMLLAFRADDRVVYLYGFAKSDRDNLDEGELMRIRVVATYWLAADATMIGAALEDGLLIEVKDDQAEDH